MSLENKPLVSIVISVYNRQKYIVECLQSCIDQDYRPIEIIMIDDGSTDETSQIIQELSEKFKNENGVSFKYVFQKNQGAPAARNLGLTLVTGNLIQFMDSDDLFTPNGISVRVSAFKDCDVVFGDGIAINKNSQHVYDFRFSDFSQHNPISFIAGKSIVTGCLLFKKECFQKVKFDPSIQVLQERELCIRMLVHGFRFKYVPGFVFLHRLPGDDNISSISWVNKNPLRYLHTAKTILNNISTQDSETIRKSARGIALSLWKRGRDLLNYGKRSEAKQYFEYAIEVNYGKIPKGGLVRFGSRITGYFLIEDVYSFFKTRRKLKRSH